MFEEGIKSCLEYLEAVPWSEDEETTVISCIEELNLPGSTTTSVLQRVSSTEPSMSISITENIFYELLNGNLLAKDDKAHREMKSVIRRLIKEETAHDVSKYIICGLCHLCYLSFIIYLSDVVTSNMDDSSDLIGGFAREVGNLLWIVDILIEKKLCDKFVELWAA